MVVSEMGEQWSPQTAPARQAEMPMICRSGAALKMGDTLGQLTVRDAAGNTVAELPILAGEDVGHVTFVQMLGRCLARGFCMGPQS